MTVADYADTYDPDTDFDRHYTLATARAISRRIAPGERVLELGCATGLMSAQVLALSAPGSWVALDRSPSFLARARGRELPTASFQQADLDQLAQVGLDPGAFDHILATNVLHELDDPCGFLARCGALLAPAGSLHVTLQNPNSIHRLCAVEMGLIDSVEEVSDRGSQWGTRRLWSADALAELAAATGLRVRTREGIMLKPLPNSLMSQLPDDVIEGFIRGAVHLPEACAMNYLVLCHD